MGRGYAAAKARKQAAAAAAAGQGAVAEPAVAAAQPAPAGEQTFAQQRTQITENNLKDYEAFRRANLGDDRSYKRKEDSISMIHGGEYARQYREVADATILARDAAKKLASAIKKGNKSSYDAVNSSARLKQSMQSLRLASEKLKYMSVGTKANDREFRDNIFTARFETRRAIDKLNFAANDMNINLRLQNLQ